MYSVGKIYDTSICINASLVLTISPECKTLQSLLVHKGLRKYANMRKHDSATPVAMCNNATSGYAQFLIKFTIHD